MKVLHILGQLNPSGAETMLYAAGPLLKDFGIDGEILATGEQAGPYAEQLANAGYRIHHIAFQKSPGFFWRVFKQLKSGGFDAIHLHTERANFWLGLTALSTSKAAIRTIHNTFPFSGLLGWVRKWQRHCLIRLGVTHVAISESVKAVELKHFNLALPLIPNWYNSERFQPPTLQQREAARTSLAIAKDKFVIVSVGNCSEVKNHGALIRALADSRLQNIFYLHIGIEKNCGERELADQLGIAERVNFLGMQTDILPFLHAADLYVMPSMHEGCPISAIEAVAAGVPALFSKVPGLSDFSAIFDGLFYCKPEPESLSEGLVEIINLPPELLSKDCATNARQAEEKFGIKRGLSEYLALYKK